MSSLEPRIPRGLVDAIRAGRCVAFVGSGFSSAASARARFARMLLPLGKPAPRNPESTGSGVRNIVITQRGALGGGQYRNAVASGRT